MLEQVWRRRHPKLHGIPGDGWALDVFRPEVYLISGAGNVTDGDHRYKIAARTAGGTTRCGDVSKLVTTNTATAGKVGIVIPSSVKFSGAPGFVSPMVSWDFFRTAAGGSTYKYVGNKTSPGLFIDDVADGSLGADEPASNTTSGALADPDLLTSKVAALTAAELNYWIAALLMEFGWAEVATSIDNALAFVPGAWANGASDDFPHDPVGYTWSPSGAVEAAALPLYSSLWEQMKLAIDKAREHYLFVTITAVNTPSPAFDITATPAGGTAITDHVGSRDDVPPSVGRLLIRALHDPDWY
jgi:hypothetical protein